MKGLVEQLEVLKEREKEREIAREKDKQAKIRKEDRDKADMKFKRGLPDDKVIEIKKYLLRIKNGENHLKVSWIAEKCGVSKKTVSQIKSNLIYKNVLIPSEQAESSV